MVLRAVVSNSFAAACHIGGCSHGRAARRRRSAEGAHLRERARELNIVACASAAAAIEGARIVFSCVTATSAKDVAEEAAHHLATWQFFVDINSVSPETKCADAAAVAPSGAAYVECAVMAPVEPYGINVPILLGGEHGPALAAILNPVGMKMEMASEIIGRVVQHGRCGARAQSLARRAMARDSRSARGASHGQALGIAVLGS
jgi:3-hydroxyisobutyrate dehydrogenase-like beta-hydroxyacid dehydrogenase